MTIDQPSLPVLQLARATQSHQSCRLEKNHLLCV